MTDWDGGGHATTYISPQPYSQTRDKDDASISKSPTSHHNYLFIYTIHEGVLCESSPSKQRKHRFEQADSEMNK